MEFGAHSVVPVFLLRCKMHQRSPDLFCFWAEANDNSIIVSLLFFSGCFHDFLPFLGFRSLTIMCLSMVFISFAICRLPGLVNLSFTKFRSFQSLFPWTTFTPLCFSPYSETSITCIWYYPSGPQRPVFLNLFSLWSTDLIIFIDSVTHDPVTFPMLSNLFS